MAVITMPTDLVVAQATVGQVRYDLVEQSESTGDQATRLLGPPRWVLSLQSRAVQSFAAADVDDGGVGRRNRDRADRAAACPES